MDRDRSKIWAAYTLHLLRGWWPNYVDNVALLRVRQTPARTTLGTHWKGWVYNLRIQIPFRPHFKDAIITGRKTATSRTTKYGSPGDEFEAFGYVFVIERHRRLRIEFVANQLYAVEGFDSPLEVLKEWRSIHTVEGFDPEQRVWVHWFRRKVPRH